MGVPLWTGEQVQAGRPPGGLLPSSIQQRCSQQAPDGAVLPAGVALGAAGDLRLLAPQTAAVFITHRKNHKLKNANGGSRGGS